MQEGEELAVVVEFDENNEPKIQSYIKPQKKGFSANEIKEAYISASSASEEMKNGSRVIPAAAKS